MSTDEIRRMVDELVADRPKPDPVPVPQPSEFERAVTKLVADGLDPIAAHQLINNAYDRGTRAIGLMRWADHLIAQRRKYREMKAVHP